MKHALLYFSGLAATMVLVTRVEASQMVYAPVNPDFGGNPFNGSVLLNEANGQNSHGTSSAGTGTSSSSVLSDFSTEITNAVLGQVSTTIAGNITSGQTGSVVDGNYRIAYSPTSGNEETVTLTDLSTGQSTTLQVPIQP